LGGRGGWGEGNFAKFQPEKCDLDLYNGFSIGKMAQIHQILKEKNSKLPCNFDAKFK
jgi:hypothetical protein